MAKPPVADQLVALGAHYEPGEERWYHNQHRQQWLSETPEEYLGWLKGYDTGHRHAEMWLEIDEDARSGRTILALENFERVGEDDKTFPRDVQVVFWSKKAKGWISYGLMLASFEPTHYREIGAFPALGGA